MNKKLRSNDVDYLKETFQYSVDTYEEPQKEAQEVREIYSNRHYTVNQIATLTERGQPIETFNVVLMMIRALTGYLGQVQNAPQIKPRSMQDNDVAFALNDYVQYVLEDNDFDMVKRRLQLDGLTSGLMVRYTDVIKTGLKDQWGRDIHQIKISHVPSWQCAIDPMAKLEDKSDSRFFHRFKWISEDNFIQLYGKAKLAKLEEDHNFLDRTVVDKDKDSIGGQGYSGIYKAHEKYLVVHSVVKENNGDTYEVQWSDQTILLRKKVTHKDVKNPYSITQMNDELDVVEFYGPFREVVESQKAINQALIQIQLLINTSKAFVEDGAVEDIGKFKDAFNRVNAVVEVNELSGIQVENMSGDIQAQYVAIDKALERIKLVLGVNDSFLGNAYASDSGRKVQIQAQHSAGMLSYMTGKMEHLMKGVGSDIAALARQYISAEQVIRTSDHMVGDRYFKINEPIMQPVMNPQTGTPMMDPQTGQMALEPVMEPVIDPASGDYVINEATGAIAIAPLGDPSSTLSYAMVDIKVESVPMDQTQEKDQLLLETVVNGPMGTALLQTNPAGYMMASSLSLRSYGAKFSNVLADIYQQTSVMINNGQMDPTLAMAGGNMQAIMGGAMGGSTGNPKNGPSSQGGPSSQTMKIPTGQDQGGAK